MSKYQIDATDQKILAFLVKNARMPFLEIARNAEYPEPQFTTC
jgi:Lrp/AsnC family transcriptional regulator for asnA, asnC and gidA